MRNALLFFHQQGISHMIFPFFPQKKGYIGTLKSAAYISPVHLPESFTPTVTHLRVLSRDASAEGIGPESFSLPWLGSGLLHRLFYFHRKSSISFICKYEVVFEIVILYLLVFLLSISFCIFHIFQHYGFISSFHNP